MIAIIAITVIIIAMVIMTTILMIIATVSKRVIYNNAANLYLMIVMAMDFVKNTYYPLFFAR